jgi:uracil-DNA glycosylase
VLQTNELDSALPPDWLNHLEEELQSKQVKNLKFFLIEEVKKGKTIFPPPQYFFNALKLTPLAKVKVVIIGQDPYHGEGQAHGLSFSVPKGVPIPPSLKNIYKELESDLGITPPNHGNLTAWAQEGVLLLNQVLSVEKGLAASHHGKGWEEFTNKIVEILNTQKEHLVFILWGAPAQKKAKSIDRLRHLCLSSPHPSPLSSYRGFFGSKPFSKANDYLISKGLDPIHWAID